MRRFTPIVVAVTVTAAVPGYLRWRSPLRLPRRLPPAKHCELPRASRRGASRGILWPRIGHGCRDHGDVEGAEWVLVSSAMTFAVAMGWVIIGQCPVSSVRSGSMSGAAGGVVRRQRT